MNFKVFAKFVMWLGGIILLGGLILFAANQPVKFDRSKSKMNSWGGRNDIGNYLNVQAQNRKRKGGRQDGTIIMGLGAIVIFIGFGLSASAKTK